MTKKFFSLPFDDFLGIMTARLLPAYLRCFDDAYISVRIAATSTAAKLELKDDKVLNKLLFLTQYDNNWKVKAHAVKGNFNVMLALQVFGS